MREDGISKKIYSMILPITAENVLQMTAGFISMSMIGRISTVAVGALGISTRITQIIWALFKGIATGGSVFIAQSYGAGDFNKIKKIAHQTLLSSIILTVIFQQMVFWRGRELLSIFNPTDDLAAAAFEYIRIVSWGLPFMVVMLIVAGVLQGMGNAKTPMKIALIMNLINIGIGRVLIFGMFGISPMGLKGAALAMVVAQIVSALIGLYILFNKYGAIGHIKGNILLNIDKKQVADIYKVGLPSSMESLSWQIAAVILTRIILSYGNTAFAAYQLALQAESISYMPATGFGIAATTFIGQCLGADKMETAKEYMKELIRDSILLTIAMASMLVFLPDKILGLMTYDKEVIKVGVPYLILMGLVQLPQNISGVLSGALRGAGFTRAPMIVAMAGLWGVRLPLSWIFTRFFRYGIVSIWVVMCFDLIFRFILSLILYKTKNIYSAKPIYENKTISDGAQNDDTCV
ncbi:MAG TPA: MATE family efflux transporter [Clostridiaceae bacterium]|nr:MATE family efflux transporter [Clostridiaceae bacterium]